MMWQGHSPAAPGTNSSICNFARIVSGLWESHIDGFHRRWHRWSTDVLGSLTLRYRCVASRRVVLHRVTSRHISSLLARSFVPSLSRLDSDADDGSECNDNVLDYSKLLEHDFLDSTQQQASSR